jgi:hypothetical protein
VWCRQPAEVRGAAVLIALLLPFSGSQVLAADEPAKTSLYVVAAGALSRTDLGLGMVEGRRSLGKNLYVSAAPAALAAEGSDIEYQFRTAATLLLDLGPLRLDDRNLWVFSDAGPTRYRNRLRVTAPMSLAHGVLRLQFFNEAYYQQGGLGWFRNVVAGGVGLDLNRTVSADAYYMSLDDDNRSRSSMFVVLLTMRIR